MKRIKNTIAALGLAAATYLGNTGKAYADQTAICDIDNSDVHETSLPSLRRGDILVHKNDNQSYSDAIRSRFRNRDLSDRAIERIIAEGLRNTQRNYHIDPCTSDYIILPRYTFNRPRQNQGNTGTNAGPNYGLTQEDRIRMIQTYDRIRLTEEGIRNVEQEINDLGNQITEVGQNLNNFRDEMADDNSEIMNRMSDRTREIVHVETTKTIRDQELRDRRQRAAERLRILNRERNNFLNIGYGWMNENVNGEPYAAGQALTAELYGSRDIFGNDWAAFVDGDGRMDFLQEYNAERNIKAVDLNVNAGIRRNLTKNLGIEGYLHFDNQAAVIWDNAGDVSVNQNSIGPGLGLRLDTKHIDAHAGLAYGFGTNDTSMTQTDDLTRLVLDAGVSVQVRPVEFNVNYRLRLTDLEAAGEDRSSTQNELGTSVLYRPNAVPGLGAGVQVRQTWRNSPANDDESTTVGGLLEYRF